MNDFLTRHVAILCTSYQRLTGRVLAPAALYTASYAVVSHGVEPDPIFNYANATALKLFEMDWATFTQLPSRLSAEEIEREARASLLARVAQHGFVDDYCGVRVSATGKRFMVKNACVWNLADESGVYYGQAALLKEWEYLPVSLP
ncbi:MAG: MEKHLA domain-containing protein [Methylophilaceae bacterium]